MGLEYRSEAMLRTADALSYARAYSIGNFQFFDAKMNSKEGFAEINLPLIRNKFIQSLDLNAAGRVTNYSTSGRVETWKVGLTSQFTDDIRIRATKSRDIRAPTLLALFDPGSSQRQTVADPARGGAPTNIATFIKGNPNLQPEIADTFTAGLVLTPRFIPGLSASIDYYKINIKGAFATPNQGNILDNCQLGAAQYCALIDRDAAGVLQSVTVASVNAAFQKTAGWDVQADYRMKALGGGLDFSVIGNYTTQLVLDSLGVVTADLNSLRGAGLNGPLKFRATYAVDYRTDRFSAGLQVRHMGAAKLNQNWTAKNVDYNDIPAIYYFDLRGSYYLDSARKIQAYLAIDNATNKSPPIIPQTSTDAFSFFFAPTRTEPTSTTFLAGSSGWVSGQNSDSKMLHGEPARMKVIDNPGRRQFVAATAAVIAGAPALLMAKKAASAKSATVEVESGKLLGLRQGGALSFRGVPDAADTGGGNRFMSPRAARLCISATSPGRCRWTVAYGARHTPPTFRSRSATSRPPGC
jgi:hypothetical protein